MPDTRTPRLLILAGIVIQVAGFAYDLWWHANNSSVAETGPGTLVRVHAGLYLGQLVTLLVVLWAAHTRVFGSGPARAGQVALLGGAVLEVVGSAGDLWAHARATDATVFHQSTYAGAAFVIAGFGVVELAARTRTASYPGR